MLRKIECIFFDLDGLLLDTEKLYTRFWMEAAQACGHNMTKETALQLRSCDSTVARAIIQRDLGAQADYAQIRSERKKRMNQYLETHPMELKTGALEILSCLDAFPHVKKVVVTSSARVRTQPESKAIVIYTITSKGMEVDLQFMPDASLPEIPEVRHLLR